MLRTLAYQATPSFKAPLRSLAMWSTGSALLAPGVTVSISDEVQLVVGGFIGLGERPDESKCRLARSGTGFPIQESFNTAWASMTSLGLSVSAYVK